VAEFNYNAGAVEWTNLGLQMHRLTFGDNRFELKTSTGTKKSSTVLEEESMGSHLEFVKRETERFTSMQPVGLGDVGVLPRRCSQIFPNVGEYVVLFV
jgi:hypothetical protein